MGVQEVQICIPLVNGVGVVCGVLGLVFVSFAFFFPWGWSFLLHSAITTTLVIFPLWIGDCLLATDQNPGERLSTL